MLPVDEQMRIITSGAAQIVPESDLKKKLERGVPLNIKLGVDPTSPDLHLGHAVPLRKMRQFQDLGHKVTLIIGNGTAMIGDPSGKNSTRPQLSQEQVEANAATYVSQAMKILDPEKTTIVHNGDWILSLDLKGMLELCSKFTVARILERDDFTKRYQSQTPIALHEFLYPVMQAFDSVKIDADVEMGGTDQLFNLLAGRELMEKMGMEPQVALTMPLLEGTDGVRKMSKSYGNYIGSMPSRRRSPTAPPTPTSSSARSAATCATPTTAPARARKPRPRSTACSSSRSCPITSPRSRSTSRPMTRGSCTSPACSRRPGLRRRQARHAVSSTAAA